MAQSLFSLVGKVALDGMTKFDKDLKEGEKKVKDLQKALGKLGADLTKFGSTLSKNISAPLAGVGVAIGALALKTGAYASELLSMSDATGLSTDTLQEFEHVARTAGVSSEAFLGAVQKLSPKLADIQSGSGEAAKAMDTLGISVSNSDGTLRSMDDLLPEIIGKLNKVEDVNQRNAIASDIFGKKLKDVAPVLSMTSEQLDAVRKSAHETGKVMSKDSIQSAEAFRLSVDNLKKDFSMLGMEIGSAFIPILRDQVMPLIQNTIIPAVKWMADGIKGLATWFGNLNPTLQKAGIAFGAIAIALGPALLIAGKFAFAIKALLPVFVLAQGGINAAIGAIGRLNTAMGGSMKASLSLKGAMTSVAATGTALGGAATGAGTAIKGLGGAILGALKGALAAILSPLGLVAAAIASVGYAAYTLHRELSELGEIKRQNTINEDSAKNTNALIKEKAAAKSLVDEYKKLEGTKGFDPAEMEKRQKAYVDSAIAADIALENQRRLAAASMTDEKGRVVKLTEEKIKSIKVTEQEAKAIGEATRARLAGFKSIDEYNAAQEQAAVVTDLARKKAEDEAEERKKAAERRRKELAGLAKSNEDTLNKMYLTASQYNELEEEAAIDKAKKLGATEAQLNVIRQIHNAQRVQMANEAAAKEADAEEEKQKRIADINAQWQDKLISQGDNKHAILEMERANAIAEAEKEGADTLAIMQYYENERMKLINDENKKRADANQQWEDKINQQALDGMKDGAAKITFGASLKLQAIEIERSKELALAAETGADVNNIESYYAQERIRINQEADKAIAESQKAKVSAWTDSVVGAVNNIGSIMNMFSANEEKRLSKEYKDRRANIEATVTDEEEKKNRLAALAEEEDAKKLEIQKEQASRDKKIGIFNTIIDTARAIVKTLADMGPIAGPIMAGVVGAMGIAQTAAIASAPEPFAAGAMIQGGRGGVNSLVGEGKQDELILPMETGTQQLANDLMAAIQAQGGGGDGVAPIEQHVHLHIGTFIGDDKGLKELERRMINIRTAEAQRAGRSG
jgi:hypothetical protein